MRSLLGILVFALLMLGRPAFAKDDDVGNVDSVLDRLEKRLLDQEADGLTFEEKTQPKAQTKGDDDTAAHYKFESKGKVEAPATEHNEMSTLAKAVTDLEGQVDQIA